jgi:hypothetical protein
MSYASGGARSPQGITEIRRISCFIKTGNLRIGNVTAHSRIVSGVSVKREKEY